MGGVPFVCLGCAFPALGARLRTFSLYARGLSLARFRHPHAPSFLLQKFMTGSRHGQGNRTGEKSNNRACFWGDLGMTTALSPVSPGGGLGFHITIPGFFSTGLAFRWASQGVRRAQV